MPLVHLVHTVQLVHLLRPPCLHRPHSPVTLPSPPLPPEFPTVPTNLVHLYPRKQQFFLVKQLPLVHPLPLEIVYLISSSFDKAFTEFRNHQLPTVKSFQINGLFRNSLPNTLIFTTFMWILMRLHFSLTYSLFLTFAQFWPGSSHS